MPHYKLTGYHSHRHPFLGFDGPGDIINSEAPLAPGIYESLAQSPTATGTPALSSVLSPIIRGVGSSVLVYVLARGFNVESKKALQTAFVFGGVNIVASIAMDYLLKEVQAVQAAQTLAPTTQ